MTLTIIDPGMIAAAINYFDQGGKAYTWNGDTSNLSDHATASPTFDTQAAIYTSSPVNQASQNSIGNNLNGLQNPLHVIPTLSYAYTSGYMTQNSMSKAVTASITQSFTYKFFSAMGSTTLSASGNLTWTSGSSTNNSTTITNTLSAPFDVPQGKIYEEKLLFDQQQVTVPYTVTIDVDGTFQETPRMAGEPLLTFSMGEVFEAIQQSLKYGQSPPPAPYKDVNWGDVHADPNDPLSGQATYVLHGALTLEAASTASVEVFDITNGAAQADLVSQYDVTPAMLLSGQGGLGGSEQPVPEPASLALLGTGLLGLGFTARARRVAFACWARWRGVLDG